MNGLRLAFNPIKNKDAMKYNNKCNTLRLFNRRDNNEMRLKQLNAAVAICLC